MTNTFDIKIDEKSYSGLVEWFDKITSSPEALETDLRNRKLQESILRMLQYGYYVFLYDVNDHLVHIAKNESEFLSHWRTECHKCLVLDKEGYIYDNEGYNVGRKICFEPHYKTIQDMVNDCKDGVLNQAYCCLPFQLPE